MLKLSSSFDFVRFILMKIGTKWVLNCNILCHFKFLTLINTIVGAGSVGAGAALRYGSDQMMRLLVAPAPQHWYVYSLTIFRYFKMRVFHLQL
jgi:hypothetical protein